MTDDILLSCRKCIVKSMINPSVFWMTDYYENENHSFSKETKRLQFLLEEEVKKNTKRLKYNQICIDQIVAVAVDGRYHRARIIDIFNKNGQFSYEVLLIDQGFVVKVDEFKIIQITNKELKNRKSCAVKVTLYSVQPISLEINEDINVTDKIFQKRISQNWSTAAFKFVKDLLQINPMVYVRSFIEDGCVIEGEIYLITEQDGTPKSLGKVLCDRNFAVFLEEGKKLFANPIVKGIRYDFDDITQKIPETASSRRLKILNIYKKNFSDSSRSVSTDSQDGSTSGIQEALQNMELKNTSSHQTESNFCFSTPKKVFQLKPASNSSSSTIKKVNTNLDFSFSTNSGQISEINNSKITGAKSPVTLTSSSGLFALVKRHEELHNQRRQKTDLSLNP